MNVLKRKSAMEKFVCKESIESIIVLPKRSSGGKSESGVGNLQISEHTATEPRNTERYEAFDRGMENNASPNSPSGTEELSGYLARREKKLR